MKISKPKFWEKKYNIISFLLFPISIILQLIIKIKMKISFPKGSSIPIISIGNIYLGGTGKTPLSISIAQALIANKKKPAIIRKYYSNHEDEQVLINESISCLYMADNRFDAINKAIREGCDIAILDDGFQDYSIKKDVNILCFNSNQLIGNGMTIPSGPLRESLNSIKKAQIIVINGEQNDIFEKKLLSIYKNIKIFYTSYKPLNIDRFANKQLFAFAGIGNPNNFFNLLKKNGLNIKKNISFPDHYEFTKFELQNLVDESLKKNLELITTEKDYCRIKKFGFNEINYLQNELHIPKKRDLMNQILKIYD